MANEVKVHRVLEGPFDIEDEEHEVWMLCLGEENGELTEIEVYFDNFDEAYTFKNHFNKSIEPIILANDTGDH